MKWGLATASYPVYLIRKGERPIETNSLPLPLPNHIMNNYYLHRELYEEDYLDYLHPTEYPEQKRASYDEDEPTLSPEERNPSLR